MRVVWTAEALSDLTRLYDFLAPKDTKAAERVIQTFRDAEPRLLAYPRLGARIHKYGQREVRRLILGRYELRGELLDRSIAILNLWHSSEDR